MKDPEAVDGYVSFAVDQPTLQAPHEAEVLALNLLSAAVKARAHRLAAEGEAPEEIPDREDVEAAVAVLSPGEAVGSFSD